MRLCRSVTPSFEAALRSLMCWCAGVLVCWCVDAVMRWHGGAPPAPPRWGGRSLPAPGTAVAAQSCSARRTGLRHPWRRRAERCSAPLCSAYLRFQNRSRRFLKRRRAQTLPITAERAERALWNAFRLVEYGLVRLNPRLTLSEGGIAKRKERSLVMPFDQSRTTRLDRNGMKHFSLARGGCVWGAGDVERAYIHGIAGSDSVNVGRRCTWTCQAPVAERHLPPTHRRRVVRG